MDKKEEYNNEPVMFCQKCLSLKIMFVDEDISFCDECGSSDVKYTGIHNWENLYEQKYSVKYLNKK